MPEIGTSDFRKGLKVIIEGDPYEMMECSFRKPGKGQAIYSVKLKNLLKGTLLDRNYKSGDSLEAADVRSGKGTYSYRDGTGYVFLDQDTFEQVTVPSSMCEAQMAFIKEGTECALLYWNEQVIGMTPPKHLVLEVTFAEPAARGNTATNVTKLAKVETGGEIQVPAFINEGDKVKVEVETGTYIERIRE